MRPLPNYGWERRPMMMELALKLKSWALLCVLALTMVLALVWLTGWLLGRGQPQAEPTARPRWVTVLWPLAILNLLVTAALYLTLEGFALKGAAQFDKFYVWGRQGYNEVSAPLWFLSLGQTWATFMIFLAIFLHDGFAKALSALHQRNDR